MSWLKKHTDLPTGCGLSSNDRMRKYFGTEVTILPDCRTLAGNFRIKEDHGRWAWHPSWFVSEDDSDWGFGV